MRWLAVIALALIGLVEFGVRLLAFALFLPLVVFWWPDLATLLLARPSLWGLAERVAG